MLKIKRILEGKLPDLTKEGYKVAKSRYIKVVGKKFKDIYTKTLQEK